MASSISLQTTLPLYTSRFRYKPVSIPASPVPFPFSLHSSYPLSLPSSSTTPPSPQLRRLHLCAAAEVLGATSPPTGSPNQEQTEAPKEKLKVVVKTMEKPRLVLKFIWMEKNIGLGLDQMIPGHGCVPLSPYYFWPRKDAWEELKTKLEEKPWISQKRMIILLNQATDIINLWQQAGGNL
ncbi:30S ribosomal protein 3-1, chloroplastic [Dendrobium catenatum]|uniref:30S ribosomal protein 3, chloroplastic n=1 Tax=Dendrobium catenatum TaxID=906689 RepID=A0A2I0WQN6_9ASPA|nr:30S ribosomal protein 3-1, chloroplastic [Dendrobium catenatum]PKU77982.1 30S ribosomal protein 3, chloroplastic [Dendrobium catenatum]